MSFKNSKVLILLCSVLFVILQDVALAQPTVVSDSPITDSLEEIEDLNETKAILRDSSSEITGIPFSHRDEDMLLPKTKPETIFKESVKYDVEILETKEVTKENIEIEERYRGPSIILDTDEFVNENIETNLEDDEITQQRLSDEAIASSHMILSIVLVVLALVSIGLYTAVVLWRSHIEQRYGMRELLVTNDNQDYWPQHLTTSVSSSSPARQV